MSGELDNSNTVEITGKIMVIAIIILFLVVVFVFLLHLYAKWFLWSAAEPTPPPQPRRNRRRFVFNPGQDPVRRGLDISILRSLPVVIFQSSEELKEGLECAVCLSEITQGEKARLLPKCNHAFHVECIDMWFQSHSTCPLCRNSVAPQHEETFTDLHEINSNQSLEEILVSGYSSESPHFPTNVLFWGDQTQVSTAGAGAGGGGGGGHLEEGSYPQASSSSSSSTSGSGNGVREEEMVVIEIPLELSDYSEEESSKSPVPTQRLRSFKRLLSREKKVNVDV
ncbi:RING-H2 finger protein ATL3-like [Mercurialis annua]|uniref:RING-H2 finger protein ATL3-like n=1 Tax=Mercurialis annua TaxID=3986 RepID=UPI0021600508|nr:RING-H2 finger protein ATL3-like [Mercurialis annua]